jgi:aryl-alcohol dehydrogenase-like predicted oxidoreductase
MSAVDASGTLTLGGDLEVHRLAFGAMRITGAGIWGPPADRDTALAVVRRAVELGVDLIDTADSYGPHVSEQLIADALYPYPEGVVIATKGGLERTGRGGAWPINGRPEHLREACEGSLRDLRVDRIDLYQLHASDPDVPYAESVGALKELQDEGKIHHVGVSNVSAEQLEEARSIVDVVAVQNQLALDFPSPLAKGEVRAATEHGIAFLPWSPLGGIGKADQTSARDAVTAIARDRGVSPQQVVLAWLLHLGPTVIPIPGSRRPETIQDSAQAAGLALADDEVEAITRAATG